MQHRKTDNGTLSIFSYTHMHYWNDRCAVGSFHFYVYAPGAIDGLDSWLAFVAFARYRDTATD